MLSTSNVLGRRLEAAGRRGVRLVPGFFGRKHRKPARYYLYLSQTKIDMLVPQLPRSFTKGLDVEITARTGVIDAKVGRRSTGSADSLVSYVPAIEKYLIGQGKVGSPDHPAEYVRGVDLMRYGVVGEHAADIAVFVSVRMDIKFALAGSSTSMVGSASRHEANHAPFYYVAEFLNQLDGADVVPRHLDHDSYADAIDIALAALPSSPHRVEFLAKVLYAERHVILASPVYVSLFS
jgi:hypothetical protein